MRIIYIHNYYQQRGGEDTIVEQDFNLLRKLGYDIKFLSFDNNLFNGTLKENVLNAPSSLYNKNSARIVESTIDCFKPDIVHIHNLFYTASPSIIAAVKRKGIPLVMTLHNYRLVCSSGLLMREDAIPCELCLKSTFPLAGIKHACFRGSRLQSAQLTFITSLHRLTGYWKKVDRYFVLTEFAKQKFLTSSLQLTPNQLVVKPNSVPDLGSSPSHIRKDYFLYVGRLSHEKGVQVLLDAAYQYTFPLLIAGDGPMKGLVEKAYAELPHVNFAGKQPRAEVVRLMKEAKAVIVPSICYEGLPTTILEAFSTGTPVICSNQDNLNQIVTDNGNGYLFKSGDAHSLAATVQKALRSPEQLSELGINGRETYLELYTEESVLQKLISVYEELVTKEQP